MVGLGKGTSLAGHNSLKPSASEKSKIEQFTTFRVNSKKKIIDLLNPLITSYLKKESIQILLQKDKIVFGDDKLDIKKEILKIFNDKHKKIKFE